MQIGSEELLQAELTDERAVIARARKENFPVASRLLRPRVREALLAVYGYARLVDDIGDEADGDRMELLDWAEAELLRASEGHASHPVFRRLSPLLLDGIVTPQPLLALVEANRLDQRRRSYDTFDELVGYCMLSAAPVGHLVLQIFEVSTPARIALSDDVCVGLQLVEHLQDVGEDARRGRVYLPQEELRRFGCEVGDLLGSSASPALRRLVAFEAARARRLLLAGVPLARQLPVPTRLAVCGFAAGGQAALAAIRRADYDVLSRPCTPRRSRLIYGLARNFAGASRQQSVGRPEDAAEQGGRAAA